MNLNRVTDLVTPVSRLFFETYSHPITLPMSHSILARIFIFIRFIQEPIRETISFKQGRDRLPQFRSVQGLNGKVGRDLLKKLNRKLIHQVKVDPVVKDCKSRDNGIRENRISIIYVKEEKDSHLGQEPGVVLTLTKYDYGTPPLQTRTQWNLYRREERYKTRVTTPPSQSEFHEFYGPSDMYRLSTD